MSQSNATIPQDYEAWRHCITVICGIPLERAYVDRRIAILSVPENEETLRFRKLYGDTHWHNVLTWFQQARHDLTTS